MYESSLLLWTIELNVSIHEQRYKIKDCIILYVLIHLTQMEWIE